MKFSQLKIGDRFRYRDTGYTKTGPLQAIADGTSSAQLIMRSAIVQTAAEQKSSPPPRSSDSDQLRQAIDAYHSECKTILQATLTDPNSDALGKLEMQYRELLKILEAVGPG